LEDLCSVPWLGLSVMHLMGPNTIVICPATLGHFQLSVALRVLLATLMVFV
jgi:hypothetical protein